MTSVIARHAWNSHPPLQLLIIDNFEKVVMYECEMYAL